MSPEDLKGGVLWDYHDAGKRSYLQTNYESSPLNRITEQYGVGDAWGESSRPHGISDEYPG